MAFHSGATGLVGGDTNARDDIFVHDRQTGVTERVSLAHTGAQANNSSLEPSISADGRYVVFTSHANNLVPNDTNDRADIFLRDRTANTTERISVDSAEGQVNDTSNAPSISGNGRSWRSYRLPPISSPATRPPGPTGSMSSFAIGRTVPPNA